MVAQFAASPGENDCRPSAGAPGPEGGGPEVAGPEVAGPEVAEAARAAGAAGLEVISAQFCLTALQLVYRFLL